jgi:hypothetical protein
MLLNKIIDLFYYCCGYKREYKENIPFHELLYHVEKLNDDNIDKLNHYLNKNNCCNLKKYYK